MIRSERYISFNDVHRGDVWKTNISSDRLVIVVTPHGAWANTFMIDISGDFEHHYQTDFGTLNACKMSHTAYSRMQYKVGTIPEEKMQEIMSIFLEKVFGLHVGESKANQELEDRYKDLQDEYYKLLSDNMTYSDIFANIKTEMQRVDHEVSEPDPEPEEDFEEVDKSNEFYSYINAPTPQVRTRVYKALGIYDDEIESKGAEAFNDISIDRIKGRPGVGPKTIQVIQNAVDAYERRN